MWFTNYLTNHKQYVTIGNYKSAKKTLYCGVPEWNSFGRYFLLCINDFPNCSSLLKFRISTDNTNIFVSSRKGTDLQNLVNQKLAKVKFWCGINKLSINYKKTTFMII